MTVYLNAFKHLLPRAKAWQITIDKTLRKFFVGLTDLPSDIRDFVDLVWFDIFPDTTRELDEWESAFGLPDVGLSTADRRTRLAGAWAATGGQSPGYIQDALHAAGFTTLYVHDWWSDDTPTVRDPNDYEAEGGYAIDNILDIGPQTPADLSGLIAADFPHFVYIGPQVILLPPTSAQRVDILQDRKRELETLVLKLCPNEKWIMMFVRYYTPFAFKFAPGDVDVVDATHGFGDDAGTTGGKWTDE